MREDERKKIFQNICRGSFFNDIKGNSVGPQSVWPLLMLFRISPSTQIILMALLFVYEFPNRCENVLLWPFSLIFICLLSFLYLCIYLHLRMRKIRRIFWLFPRSFGLLLLISRQMPQSGHEHRCIMWDTVCNDAKTKLYVYHTQSYIDQTVMTDVLRAWSTVLSLSLSFLSPSMVPTIFLSTIFPLRVLFTSTSHIPPLFWAALPPRM